MLPTTQGQMSAMAGMGKSGDHGCMICYTGAAGKVIACSPICAAPLTGEQELAAHHFDSQHVGFVTLEQWLTGRSQPPDPYPPRPFHFV
jgi:hypothetical protein